MLDIVLSDYNKYIKCAASVLKKHLEKLIKWTLGKICLNNNYCKENNTYCTYNTSVIYKIYEWDKYKLHAI